ncbi:hypothetical protein N7462_003384 [Penicillium macrosclerotiorum]|uniref:uncharacterized protein n=1 Tax=Penicillium macrosclerotiorum TaxID=303699 RepID=UPI0025489E47|nr:uncharacterized protein N7462_003384 [Penicillium macrosclerotiorum]KAJ5688992.1 hypothetical protein N7462_003384 [Penicillium macrosclerotiorum]
MSKIPAKCEVLVIGGGPGGAYTATCLAREGIDTVLLEADIFPSHEFHSSHGFFGCGGPEGYTWNIVRSEADHMIFKHAEQHGVKTFDGVRVGDLEFQPWDKSDPAEIKLAEFSHPNPGRPVSAYWSRKDGTSGMISFEYLVDASGRVGLVSTKYYKNRRYNQGLKNIASWGYWKNMELYDQGGPHEDQPFFEALSDASGWVWTIPLHGDIVSVGVVRNQAISMEEKKKMGSPSTHDFYLENLKLVPGILSLMKSAELVSEIKSASDWSYSASSYASPHIRVVGDAGCFIDPFFSSGVHLAFASGLSAAATICASRRGDCDEKSAADWHTKKVAEGYTRFLLVVLTALKQIKDQDESVLTDWDEETFDRAFSFFRPIIQGTSDVQAQLTESEISETINFCFKAFIPVSKEQKEEVLRKMENFENINRNDESFHPRTRADFEASMSPDEARIMNTIRAREMLRSEDTINIDTFSVETINGLTVYLQRGQLSLVKPSGRKVKKIDALGLFHGEQPMGSTTS